MAVIEGYKKAFYIAIAEGTYKIAMKRGYKLLKSLDYEIDKDGVITYKEAQDKNIAPNRIHFVKKDMI